jgi:hypothetical protein
MVATLLGTGLAVGLAEVYSETLGAEVRTRRRLERADVRAIWTDTLAVAFGIGFPAVFFVLAAAGAIEDDSAFDLAKWSGLGLIALYGFLAARLSGAPLTAALVKSAAVASIAAFLIALKALVQRGSPQTGDVGSPALAGRWASVTTAAYEIRIKGLLSDSLSGAFEDFTVAMRPAETIMRGELRDQSELHGVLDQIQLLGLELIEVRQIEQNSQS